MLPSTLTSTSAFPAVSCSIFRSIAFSTPFCPQAARRSPAVISKTSLEERMGEGEKKIESLLFTLSELPTYFCKPPVFSVHFQRDLSTLKGPIVYRLGHLVLIQESGVRFSVGLPLVAYLYGPQGFPWNWINLLSDLARL